jgi:hypothetical protein
MQISNCLIWQVNLTVFFFTFFPSLFKSNYFYFRAAVLEIYAIAGPIRNDVRTYIQSNYL